MIVEQLLEDYDWNVCGLGVGLGGVRGHSISEKGLKTLILESSHASELATWAGMDLGMLETYLYI